MGEGGGTISLPLVQEAKMPNTRDRVRQAVEAAVRAVLPQGREVAVVDSTKPITDLGLASVDGVEVALILQEALGVEIPDDQNPLVEDRNDKSKRARSVREVVDWLMPLVGAEQGAAADAR
jgi:acyl carrier protein